MNIRIAFRIQEQRDVDLILGQGMLKAGWHAHKLNAPGKFLIWSPEHDTPRRARAYLITDDDAQQAVARHAPARPQLDAISRHALTTAPTAPAVIRSRTRQATATARTRTRPLMNATQPRTPCGWRCPWPRRKAARSRN